ncbi:DUF4062 domain-containing protein [Idiomarina loihiensis]|uniref:Uncharacterized conserved protein n=1 Tax=Idiomarina loihiensis (strain ATCC BAA-735 / DSM 15497 / L2-TR) TaxID=283942 RepID=Q5R183_IDILO|nr:DUF4062 domain-containing protein [Idiomarina loihiensis]AAV82919.1 Uncharacterized conserved protein [Idiomarina loihiensis L2TR]AGM36964.1 hypothetical protein K734_10515 [Idiomarina loihiensis GSL 199]
MAIPKVFISSTCFDLSEVREQLNKFVRSFGFDPILSEHGDVFYHPDLHTHDACVHEVSNCQLFILIIGGRFGGGYVKDKSKSITNAEYEAAKAANVPVFTYIRNSVLNNHHIYRENRNQKFIDKINFPAVEKQDDAENIFKFIDDVRRSPVNNAFEGFSNFNDIEVHLRKQWAGLFFEFLRTREVKTQIDATNHLLSNLKDSNGKLEALVKSLYRSSSADEAKVEESISEIETYANTKKFFAEIFNLDDEMPITIELDAFIGDTEINKIASVTPENKSWVDYLLETGLFYESDFGVEENEPHLMFTTGKYCFGVEGYVKNKRPLYVNYEKGVLKSTKEQRVKILNELLK